jgi:hypothetical protein
MKHIIKQFFRYYLVFLLGAIPASYGYSQSGTDKPANPVVSGNTQDAEKAFWNKFKPEKEIVTARTSSSKQFKNDDGSITFIADVKPIHYQDGNQWKEINTDIVSNTGIERSVYKYCNLTNEVKTYYPSTFNNGMRIEMPQGALIQWQNSQMAWANENGSILGSPINANNSSGNVSASSITYSSVYGSNIDATYIQGSENRELFYIINNKSAISNRPVNTVYLAFYETVVLPAGYTIVGAQGRLTRNDSVGIHEIIIKDEKGNPAITINPIYFYDSHPQNRLKRTFHTEYNLNVNGNIAVVSYMIPVKWFDNPKRVYPVVIDPDYNNYNTNKTTGTVYDDGYAIYNGVDYSNDFIIGIRNDPGGYYWAAGWMEFNLTSLTGTVSDADLYMNQGDYSAGDFSGTVVKCEFTKLTTRPSTYVVSGNGNTSLYNAINTGTSYCTHSFTTASSDGWKIVTELGSSSTALADITAAAGGAYCLGADPATSGTTDNTDHFGDATNYINFFNWTETTSYRPKLVLTTCTPPTANAGTDQTVCASTATMAATNPSPNTGAWTLISGSGSATSATYNSGVTGLGTGANTFRWTVTATGGCTATDDVVITNNTPTTAAAGNDATTCTGQYSLSGNSPGTGCTGAWSVISGTGTFTNATVYNTTVSSLTSGTNEFRWTITKGSCTSTDNVVITYSALPAATISTPGTDPITWCAASGSIVANSSTGVWSVVSGTGTFASSSSYSTTVSGLSSGVNIIRWTVTATGLGCVNQDNTTIFNATPVTANAGPDQNVSTTTATLNGNNPVSPQTGAWSESTIASVTTPSAYNSGVTGMTVSGDYTFTWTISPVIGSGCTPTTDDVIIHVTIAAAPEAGLIITDNLANLGGYFYDDEDPNFFIMNGSSKYIHGENGNYYKAKVYIKGTITFDGSISATSPGKFDSTRVQNAKTFTIYNSRTYKNGRFTNEATGTVNMNASSVWENSEDWHNYGTQTLAASSTVKFNGDGNCTSVPPTVRGYQEVYSKIATSTNVFGNVEIANTQTPHATDTSIAGKTGVYLIDNMSLQNGSILTFTDGVLMMARTTSVIVNYASNTAVTYGGSNSDYSQSWVGGNIRRYIANASDGEYVFPVGISNRCNRAILTNNSMPNASTFYLDCRFRAVPVNMNTSFPSGLTECGGTYASVCTEGDWTFDKTGTIDGTYDLKLYFNGFTSLSSPTDDNKFSIISRPSDLGNGSNWALSSGTCSITTVASGYVNRLACNTFSKKGIGKSNTPLPVELLAFNTSCLGDKIKLTWSTASETNNDYFSIDRSKDNYNWEFVTTVNGNGNSNSVIDYSAFDISPYTNTLQGTEPTYYRLKQVDFDGKFEYFGPVSTMCEDQNSEPYFNAFVNENRDIIVDFDAIKDQNYLINLFDYNGKKLIDVNGISLEGMNQEILGTINLTKGIYILIFKKGADYHTKKIIL